LSQQVVKSPAQQSGPHFSSPAGQQHPVAQGTWIPGQVGGRGVGVGRRAASTEDSIALPAIAVPLKPNRILIAERRVRPAAIDLTRESKRVSSMNPVTSGAKIERQIGNGPV
jgi:hypothetical protein